MKISLFCLVTICAIAQPQGIDFNAPALSSHASLPVNSARGENIEQKFGPELDQMAAKGEAHPSFAIVTQDEPDRGFTAPVSRIQAMTCNADAIVIGRLHTGMAHFNSAKNAIYRDVDFDVDLVLHDNQKSSLLNTRHMLVTGIGGSMRVGAGTVIYQDNNRPLLMSNKTYLLFLQYIPQTNAYAGFDPFGTLELSSTSQWIFSRSAYHNTAFPELQDVALRTAIAKAVCQ